MRCSNRFELSRRLVTNGEWQQFIDDGGYQNAALWLSDGWAWVNRCGIAAPLYWRDGNEGPEAVHSSGMAATRSPPGR